MEVIWGILDAEKQLPRVEMNELHQLSCTSGTGLSKIVLCCALISLPHTNLSAPLSLVSVCKNTSYRSPQRLTEAHRVTQRPPLLFPVSPPLYC